MTITYRMYVTKDPQEAVRAYQDRTGHVPTMILARPEAELTKGHPLLVRNRTAPTGALLVTHEGTTPEFGEREGLPISWAPATTIARGPEKPATRGRGRPRSECRCPMCDAPVVDFNRLGFWWGWQYSIMPPYWDDLSQYVRARDGYRCQSCHKELTSTAASIHHIVPKEDGGPDSARNLQTLCRDCHGASKAIMGDNETK